MAVEVADEGVHDERLPISVFRLGAKVAKGFVLGEDASEVVVKRRPSSGGGAGKIGVFQLLELNEDKLGSVWLTFEEILAGDDHLAVISPEKRLLYRDARKLEDVGAKILGYRRAGIARLHRLVGVWHQLLPELEHVDVAEIFNLVL